MAIHAGETAPYTAANGHRMVAPIMQSKHGGEYTVWSWAHCTDDCRACRSWDGGDWQSFAGEDW